MALFTQAEAEAVTITYCTPELIDSVHNSWVINVVCADGHGTQWKDHTLADDCSEADFKAAVVTYMMTQEKCGVIPVYSEGSSLGIEGETAAP